ncbi:MAG: hypothetical protein COT73_11290 [Bdellovibrio sp. CG10_big_fil_rev_8_21_14_0_10_47_8]|nr:MAG: hypothetical protein COT73_11290 [Bdellovibrio sp. CG10_big_fil_rev_8_21_14_0_10_47_8]
MNLPEHEKLFDEICGKLHELSQQTPNSIAAKPQETFEERLEKMQFQLRKSQDELKAAQQEIHDRIKSLDNLTFNNSDLNQEMKRLSELLEQERMNNSKLSTDLAKSLEMNLRLQFEIEEVRSKSTQVLNEEKKHNLFLQDKVKNMSHELDLAQALANETRIELSKAKDRFQLENSTWQQERKNFQTQIQNLQQELEEKKSFHQTLEKELHTKLEEMKQLSDSLTEYDTHTVHQHEMMKNLSAVAEKKMIELKMALDKKGIECQDYYSHLQQAMTQIHVLRQENSALKDYISKLTNLHQQQRTANP